MKLVATAAAAAIALAAAAPASAIVPVVPSGSSLGEGVPLKAYATLSPTVHLFGDTVTASVAVVADTRSVDPARLRVRTVFRPYAPVHEPTVSTLQIGRFAQVTWTWTLRCLTSSCVPQERFHVFRFSPVHVDYVAPSGARKYSLVANWPKVEVLSQVSPGVIAFLAKTRHLNWRFHITPVASPTYRISATWLYWLVLGAGIAVLLAAAVLVSRWYRVLRPRQAAIAGTDPTSSTLERALAVLEWAHARGDETLQRKALERVAGEIVVEAPELEVDDLSRTARELAWSSRTPEDDEVESFSERARETGKHGEDEDTPA
jgi:hypothetical protein